MKTFLLSLALLSALLPAVLPAVAADFAPRKDYAGQPLERVGTASFTWLMFFKVYDAALYLEPGEAPAQCLSPEVARALVVEYARSVEAKTLIQAADKVLRESYGEDLLRRFESELERMNAVYRDVGPGDRYSLAYDPQKGTTLFLNDEALVTVEGSEFASYYFSIWLGDHPAARSLRRDLLGASADEVWTPTHGPRR